MENSMCMDIYNSTHHPHKWKAADSGIRIIQGVQFWPYRGYSQSPRLHGILDLASLLARRDFAIWPRWSTTVAVDKKPLSPTYKQDSPGITAGPVPGDFVRGRYILTAGEYVFDGVNMSIRPLREPFKAQYYFISIC